MIDELDDIFSDVVSEVKKTEVVAVAQNIDERPWQHLLKIEVSYGTKFECIKRITDNILRVLDVFECEHTSQWRNHYEKSDDGYLVCGDESIEYVCVGFKFKHKRRSYCYIKRFLETLESKAEMFSDVLNIDLTLKVKSNMEYLYSYLMGNFEYEGRFPIEHFDRVINYSNIRKDVIRSAAYEWAINYKIKNVTFDETLNNVFNGLEFCRHLSGNSTDMSTGSFYFSQSKVLRNDFKSGDFFEDNSFFVETRHGVFYKKTVMNSYVVRSEGYRELYIFEINHPMDFYNWVYLDIDHTIGFESTKFALTKIFGDSKETNRAISVIKKKLFKNRY